LFEALEENIDNSLFIKQEIRDFLKLVKKYRRKYSKMKLTDLLSVVLIDSGYEEYIRKEGDLDRLDNLAELKQSIFEFETTSGEEVDLEEYLNNIALLTNTDTTDRPDSVKLMTIHSAKGLEFPYVFVCGMSEGIFPSSRAMSKKQLEEERRLAYVAFTRAEDKLYLTDSEGFSHAIQRDKYPSRFIFNAGQENVRYIKELPEELINEYTKEFPDVQQKKVKSAMRRQR
jgi:DNA helicase-2/ATP-dependent DNA helicase PcrA